MPIRVEGRMEGPLTLFTIEGGVSFEEVVEATSHYYSNLRTLHMLWDFRAGTAAELTKEEIRQIARVAAEKSTLREGGKTALVTSRVVDCGLANMFSALADTKQAKIAIGTFTDYEEALRWLNEPPQDG